jgi:hypothetical protein
LIVKPSGSICLPWWLPRAVSRPLNLNNISLDLTLDLVEAIGISYQQVHPADNAGPDSSRD